MLVHPTDVVVNIAVNSAANIGHKVVARVAGTIESLRVCTNIIDTRRSAAVVSIQRTLVHIPAEAVVTLKPRRAVLILSTSLLIWPTHVVARDTASVTAAIGACEALGIREVGKLAYGEDISVQTGTRAAPVEIRCFAVSLTISIAGPLSVGAGSV